MRWSPKTHRRRRLPACTLSSSTISRPVPLRRPGSSRMSGRCYGGGDGQTLGEPDLSALVEIDASDGEPPLAHRDRSRSAAGTLCALNRPFPRRRKYSAWRNGLPQPSRSSMPASRRVVARSGRASPASRYRHWSSDRRRRPTYPSRRTQFLRRTQGWTSARHQP